MKPWMKILIGAIAGFGGGFAAGFFCHKKLNDIQFKEISAEEMEELEKAVIGEKEEKEEKLPNLEDLPSEPDELRKTLQGKVSYIQADQEAKKRFAGGWDAIQRYSDEENANHLPVEKSSPLHDEDSEHYDPDEDDGPYDLEDGFDEDFMETIEKETVEPGQMEPPHVISLSEFYNERQEYDKITIDWWEPDDTYMNEREEVIADIVDETGMDPKALFARNGPDEDPDVRFIRNEGNSCDYEIVRHHITYLEATGGG